MRRKALKQPFSNTVEKLFATATSHPVNKRAFPELVLMFLGRDSRILTVKPHPKKPH